METEEPIHSCTVNCLDHIPGSREFVNFQQKKKWKKCLILDFSTESTSMPSSVERQIPTK